MSAGSFPALDDTAMIDLKQIRKKLAAHQPQLLTQQDFRRAAVAMVLREQAGETEVLLIRRAEHELDPWSGDLAFPGGGVDPTDRSSRAAAERETFEEIGLELLPHHYLGRSDDLAGAYLSIHIACFVYQLEDDVDFRLNGEVVDLFWVPFSILLDPARNRLHEFRYRGAGRRHPVVDLSEWSDRPLWGITYRLLETFLGRFELSFSHPEHF